MTYNFESLSQRIRAATDEDALSDLEDLIDVLAETDKIKASEYLKLHNSLDRAWEALYEDG